MLDERPNAFDERNLFFHGLLGLLSASEKLQRVLEAEGEEPGEPVAHDEPFLLGMLGFIAFRQRMLAALSKVDAPNFAALDASEEMHRPSARSLLR